jgi:hypothetical protein
LDLPAIAAEDVHTFSQFLAFRELWRRRRRKLADVSSKRNNKVFDEAKANAGSLFASRDQRQGSQIQGYASVLLLYKLLIAWA